MVKLSRQKKIVSIIRTNRIETQEQLAGELNRSGFTVTQATVSRDIKELGLIKVSGKNNTSFYALPDTHSEITRGNRLKRQFAGSVQSIDSSENLIVIKTLPGEAQGVASSLDQTGWREVIGTVAGDDTIIIVVKPKIVVSKVLSRLQKLAGG